MEEKIIEINELEKKVTGFVDIPRGNENTAYVFFQSKDNNKYIISTEKRKIMAAELRMGKYDRIMTVHRGEFDKVIKRTIACEEEGHSFFVEITIKYFIIDPEKIYLNHIYQVTDEIEKTLADVEFQLSEEHSFLNQASFREEITHLVKEKLDSLIYLKCSFQIKVEIDDSAKRIIDRMLEHEFKKAEADLSAVEKKMELENNHELQQIKLDNERKAAEQQALIDAVKVEHLGTLMRKYGTNAGNMLAYANNELSGAQLSEVINRTTRENRADLVNTIIRLKAEGILSKDIAAQSSVSALGMGAMGMLEMDGQEEDQAQPENAKYKWNDADTEDGEI